MAAMPLGVEQDDYDTVRKMINDVKNGKPAVRQWRNFNSKCGFTGVKASVTCTGSKFFIVLHVLNILEGKEIRTWETSEDGTQWVPVDPM